jgi:hypothetical protein
MTTSIIRILSCIITIFAVAEARADVQILKPDVMVAGHTQLFWAEAWWQWIFSNPDATNPNNDQTGAFAGNGNTGPVFFLAGNFGGKVARTITVPSGKPVLFPVFTNFFGAIDGNGQLNPSPCPSPLTLSCALNLVTTQTNMAKGMIVQIDNKINLSPPEITSFRQTSKSFFLVTFPNCGTTPPCGLFGIPGGTYFPGNPVWVQDGYWIMLNLSAGTHTLHFQVVLPAPAPFQLNVTDKLNVQ